MALKVWPFLLVLPLWVTGRRRSAIAAVATFTGVSMAGALAFGISPRHTIEALERATQRWIGYSANGSAIGWLVRAGLPYVLMSAVAIGFTIVISLFVSKRSPTHAIPTAIVLGLLVSPLSWEHYDVVLLGVSVWLLAKQGSLRIAAILWLILAELGGVVRVFNTPSFTWLGARTLFGRLLLAAAILIPVFVTLKAQLHNAGAKTATQELG